jgi:hypothetical protein
MEMEESRAGRSRWSGRWNVVGAAPVEGARNFPFEVKVETGAAGERVNSGSGVGWFGGRRVMVRRRIEVPRFK